MNILSRRVIKVKPSATRAVTAKAYEVKAQGIQIVPMGSGEPDIDTQKNIQEAAIDAKYKQWVGNINYNRNFFQQETSQTPLNHWLKA
jgi:aspartate/methionine/tyrosine aminotransferase